MSIGYRAVHSQNSEATMKNEAILGAALSIAACTSIQQRPASTSTQPDGSVLQFTLVQLGAGDSDKVRVVAVVKNVGAVDVYVSSDPEFDWFSEYGMTVSMDGNRARSSGRNIRGSISRFERQACPSPGATFV